MFGSLKRSMAAFAALATLGVTSGVAMAAPLILEDSAPPRISKEESDERLQARSGVVTRVQLPSTNRQRLAQMRMEFEVFVHDEDIRGVEASRYEGQYFHPELEERRKCIVKRESEGHYDVVSPSGGYFGAYQMSPELGRGVTWMMLPEHKELLGTERAKELLADLRERPVNTWSRYWQDAAFSTIHNWEGLGSGAQHWAGGRWSC